MHKRRERNLRKNNFFDSISFSIEGKSNDLFFSSILTDLRSQILFYPYSINERDRFSDRISSKRNKWYIRGGKRIEEHVNLQERVVRRSALFSSATLFGTRASHSIIPWNPSFASIDNVRPQTIISPKFHQLRGLGWNTWGRLEGGRGEGGGREREEKSGRISRYPFVSVGWAYNGRSYEKSDLSLASPRGYLYWET